MCSENISKKEDRSEGSVSNINQLSAANINGLA